MGFAFPFHDAFVQTLFFVLLHIIVQSLSGKRNKRKTGRKKDVMSEEMCFSVRHLGTWVLGCFQKDELLQMFL